MADAVVGEVLLKNVRLSFAALYEPAKDRKDKKTGELIKGKYKANFLIPKNTAEGKREMAKVRKACDEVKEKKWGNKIPKLKPNQVCVRDGDLEDYEGYEGMFYVSASNNDRPALITKHKDDKGEWLPAPKGKLYSGCYVNALIRIWAQDDPDYGKRLNCSVEAVQFAGKGEAFSGGGPVDTKEKFSEIEEDEGEDYGDYGEDEDEDDDIDSVV
jgi:hypothetical protein